MLSICRLLDAKVDSRASSKLSVEVEVDKDVEDVGEHVQVFDRIRGKIADDQRNAVTIEKRLEKEKQECACELRQTAEDVDDGGEYDHDVGFLFNRTFLFFLGVQPYAIFVAQFLGRGSHASHSLHLLLQITLNLTNEADVEHEIHDEENKIVPDVIAEM